MLAPRLAPIVRRAAVRFPQVSRRTYADSAGTAAIKAEARRNPELYVLAAIMASVFGAAGYYFGRNPTTSGKEVSVPMVPGSEPWNTGKTAKYEYHPYGDTSAEKKDAPSPLYVSIVPNVNLPKELHEKYNRYGKDEYP